MPNRWNFAGRCGLLVLCGMICIAVSAPSYGAENTFDGVYTGKKVRQEGPPDSCVAEDDVSVTIAGEILTFTDSTTKNLKIDFHPKRDGSFMKAYDALSDKYLAVQGKITGDVLDAGVFNMYTKCGFHLRLTKQH